MSKEDMQNDFKHFVREGANAMLQNCLEFFIYCRPISKRFLRTGQDKPLENNVRRTMFTPEQDKKKTLLNRKAVRTWF